MISNITSNQISLITLTIFIISLLIWLVIQTLKEGRKALKETNKN